MSGTARAGPSAAPHSRAAATARGSRSAGGQIATTWVLARASSVAPGVSREVDGQPTVDDRLAVLVERGWRRTTDDHLGPTRPASLALAADDRTASAGQVLLAFDRIVGSIVGHTVGEQPIDLVLDPLVDPDRGLRIERQRRPPHPEHPVDPRAQPDRALLLLQPWHCRRRRAACGPRSSGVPRTRARAPTRANVHQDGRRFPASAARRVSWHLAQRTGGRIDVGAGHVAGVHRGLERVAARAGCDRARITFSAAVHRDVRCVREHLLPVAGLRRRALARPRCRTRRATPGRGR